MSGVDYYKGDDPYETIKVIEAWDLGYNLSQVLRYISRAGKKQGETNEKDLRKAMSYLHREIYGEWPWIRDKRIERQMHDVFLFTGALKASEE